MRMREKLVPPEGRCVMVVLDMTGDTRTTWDPQNAADVQNAREQFAAAVGRGAVAHYVREGVPAERMKSFDPEARAMIMVAPVAGG